MYSVIRLWALTDSNRRWSEPAELNAVNKFFNKNSAFLRLHVILEFTSFTFCGKFFFINQFPGNSRFSKYTSTGIMSF